MEALASEHLILIVAAVIVLNRGFEKTGLRLLRPAYVAVQAFDLAVVALLSWARIPELPTRADFMIRIFLMLFVAYHMVLNSQGRGRALRQRAEDRAEEEAKLQERRDRLARAAAIDAEIQSEADVSPLGSVTEPAAD